MITNIYNKVATGALALLFPLTSALFTSCSDFFDQESDHIIFADQDHLNNAVDTIYSVTGIMDRMQALADRTILLGELRGDLVTVTDYAPADVRQIANFEVDDNNAYNVPRDYYAVINNCNYFIAKADTALKNNRNEYIFMREYAAVKAYRAWAYLQLALNYGQARFVTTPILTEQAANAEERYPMLGLTAICEELIKDLQPLVPTYASEYPRYGSISNVDTRMSYFPLYILLGELNLWAGHYKEAALSYYKYISTRNGLNYYYYTGTNSMSWGNKIQTLWTSYTGGFSFSESYGTQSEMITIIPIDSLQHALGKINKVRWFFNSDADENDYHVSIVPSDRIVEISEAQDYCMVTEDNDTIIVPKGLDKHRTGDLRLKYWWIPTENDRGKNNERLTTHLIGKNYTSRNIHLWRRQMVYLHMAEALNRAGYPRFAFKILETGINNRVISTDVLPYCHTAADSAYVNQFDFPNLYYTVKDHPEATVRTANDNVSQQGIHSRGCGDSRANPKYVFPKGDIAKGDTLTQQVDSVEQMIVTEGALEFAFEGLRYYDLMRVAMHRNDPAFLADRVYARRGELNVGTVKTEIKQNLYDQNNWYLKWNGKLGLGSK